MKKKKSYFSYKKLKYFTVNSKIQNILQKCQNKTSYYKVVEKLKLYFVQSAVHNICFDKSSSAQYNILLLRTFV